MEVKYVVSDFEMKYKDVIEKDIEYLYKMNDSSAVEYDNRLKKIIEEMKGNYSLKPYGETIPELLAALSSDVENYCYNNRSKIQRNYVEKRIKLLIKDLPRDTTDNTWKKFIRTINKSGDFEELLKDIDDVEMIRELLAKATIEILKEQEETEGYIDLTTAIRNIFDSEFLFKYFVDEIKTILINFVQSRNSDSIQFQTEEKQFSKEDMTVLDFVSLLASDDEQEQLEAIGNSEIWKILTGKDNIEIRYELNQIMEQLENNVTDFREEKSEGIEGIEGIEGEKNDRLDDSKMVSDSFKPIPFLNTLFKWKKPVCTLKIGENVCEYRSWNFIGDSYDNFSIAEEISFHTDIPEKQITKLVDKPSSRLRKLYFEKGVKRVPNMFDIAQCRNLEFIYIAESVEEILPDAFKGLKRLKKIIFEAIPSKVGFPIFWGSSVDELEIQTKDNIQKLTLKNCGLKRLTICEKDQPFYSIRKPTGEFICWDLKELEKHRRPFSEVNYQIHRDGETTDESPQPRYGKTIIINIEPKSYCDEPIINPEIDLEIISKILMNAKGNRR